MKNLSLTTLLILITLGFSSCSVEDDSVALQEPTAEDFLKSFELNKSSSGDYSLGYQLSNGVAADNVLDSNTNTNNINLYTSENTSRSNQNQSLNLRKGELRVSFNNADQSEIYQSVTVLDDDIQARGEYDGNLESWGMTGYGDDTYELGFKVKEGIAVDIIYDGDRGVYEIHLNEDSDATQSEFNQTFTKEEGETLHIEFVNDNGNRYASRTGGDGTTGGDNPNRPVIVVDDNGNG